MFPCAHVPKRLIRHIRSSINSFDCVRDEHEPISFQCVGVMRINSALCVCVCVCYQMHTHICRVLNRPPFLWVPVAEINSRYDCYLSPQGCPPCLGPTGGLFDEYVPLISFNLWFPSGNLVLRACLAEIWSIPRVCISERRLTSAVLGCIVSVEVYFMFFNGIVCQQLWLGG